MGCKEENGRRNESTFTTLSLLTTHSNQQIDGEAQAKHKTLLNYTQDLCTAEEEEEEAKLLYVRARASCYCFPIFCLICCGFSSTEKMNYQEMRIIGQSSGHANI